MLIAPATDRRDLLTQRITADLVIVGGGLAGTVRGHGGPRRNQVILVQDRPVLGGNASSEVRLWILGATSHMGNNNRWAREGGVIDECSSKISIAILKAIRSSSTPSCWKWS